MFLTFQYPYYAYHKSSSMSSFHLNYTYLYTKQLHWFTHFIQRNTVQNIIQNKTQNLTICAYPTSSEVTKSKKR